MDEFSNPVSHADLQPEIDPSESVRLLELAAELQASRPIPSAALRSRIRSRIIKTTPASRPERLRLLISAYAASGTALLAIAGVGLTGIGPFAS